MGAGAGLAAEAVAAAGFVSVNKMSALFAATVFSPIPETRFKSSAVLKGPFLGSLGLHVANEHNKNKLL